jgi:hypothetical protein
MSTKDILSAFFILIVLAILIFVGLYSLYIYSIEYLVYLLLIITVAGAILLVRSYFYTKVRADIDLEEYKKILAKTTHPLFYARIMKRVTIKDTDGNAEIDYRMECKNTSSEPLCKIKHEIEHDGKLASLSAYVNGEDFTKDLTLENFHTLKVLEDGTEVEIKKPFTLKLMFDLTSRKIRPAEDFGYGYTFTCDKLFPKIKEKGKESTAVFINHPTSLLVVSVELPDTMQFVPEGVYVEVLSKHEVEDHDEENRCSIKYPYRLLNHKRRILWELENPKIASYYVLYIQAICETRGIIQKT